MTEPSQLPNKIDAGPIFEDQPQSIRAEPVNMKCICPGNRVPFYCPKHGSVENPDWPLLKAPAEIPPALEENAGSVDAAPRDQTPDAPPPSSP
jgi:hypothetical protein